MTMLPILLAMLSLSPLRTEAHLLFLTQLASAIDEGTDDPREREVLTRIGWHESNYRRHVASCRVTGDHGKSFGVFQVQPRTAQDRADACGTLNAQVRVALRFIRRSVEFCSENRGHAKLNLYTSGRCDRGDDASRLRWGDATSPLFSAPIRDLPASADRAVQSASDAVATDGGAP